MAAGKPGKRKATTQPTRPAGAIPEPVRIGFAPDARRAFDGLSQNVREGLRRKLRDFGRDQKIGKPLVGALRGYWRITYGRVRSIASVKVVTTVADGIVLVFVLHIGLRAEGSLRDPYEIAMESIRRGDDDALEALDLIVQQLQDNGIGEE